MNSGSSSNDLCKNMSIMPMFIPDIVVVFVITNTIRMVSISIRLIRTNKIRSIVICPPPHHPPARRGWSLSAAPMRATVGKRGR
eukprot:8887851-Pyramimonas_sp.AAC.1